MKILKGGMTMQKQTDESQTRQTKNDIEAEILRVIRLGKQRRQNIKRRLRTGKMVKSFR